MARSDKDALELLLQAIRAQQQRARVKAEKELRVLFAMVAARFAPRSSVTGSCGA